jgi:hypothetical protein
MTGVRGLLLIGAGLAAVIALEISNTPRDDVSPLTMRTAAEATPAPSSAGDHSGDWVTAILTRPLFSPDRRPAAGVATGARATSVPGLPRLAGIMVGPFGRSAIFAADGTKPIVVQEGGRVAAYTVNSIEATQVRLLGPEGTQVLYPSFAPAAAPARRPVQATLPR